MASALYDRYVPPKPKGAPPAVKKSTTRTTESPAARALPTRSKTEESDETPKKERSKKRKSAELADETKEEPPKRQKKEKKKKPKSAEPVDEPNDGPIKKRKKEKKPEAVDPADENEDTTEDLAKKHKSVFTKFEQSSKVAEKLKKKKKKSEPTPESEEVEEEELHDLAPLPQPSNPPEVDTGPISSLPPWLSNPTVVQPDATKPFQDLGLSKKVLTNLEKKGFTEAFSIQEVLIPLIMPGITQHRGDICVSAPTGSGKTLAYALPLVELLRKKAITRLRAIVVVPTRELVQQVTSELETVARGTGVKVGTATGSTPLAQEQKQLVQVRAVHDFEAAAAMREADRQKFLTGFWKYDPLLHNMLSTQVTRFTSAVDILVCTPGRLVEHIESTRGFSLKDVEYLVIDEADRLLDASFQQWVTVLLSNLRDPEPEADPEKFVSMLFKFPRVVRKIILSATMTRDVGRLATLELWKPTLVSVSQSKAEDTQEMDLPSTLREVAIPVGDGSKKPLYLLELLKTIMRAAPNEIDHSDPEEAMEVTATSNPPEPATSPGPDPTHQAKSGISNAARILVFTNNNEDAMRLQHILLAMDPALAASVGTLTKLSSKHGRKALSRFKTGRAPILIATDRASRGLDVPDLGHVVGYDAPRDLNTYVHRAGRTARAGAAGTAWSLYTEAEGWWFWNGIARAPALHRGEGRVRRGAVDVAAFTAVEERYQRALEGLKEAVTGGK